MEFIHTLLPRFDDAWVAQCEAIVSDNGGNPPHMTCTPYPPYKTYAYPSVVDDENQAAMGECLKGRDSDMVSRFAVLRYLWAASQASVPSDGGRAFSADGGIWEVDDDEGDLATEAMNADGRKVLVDFVDRLAALRHSPTWEGGSWRCGKRAFSARRSAFGRAKWTIHRRSKQFGARLTVHRNSRSTIWSLFVPQWLSAAYGPSNP